MHHDNTMTIQLTITSHHTVHISLQLILVNTRNAPNDYSDARIVTFLHFPININ